MKKVLTMFLFLGLIIGLVGCGTLYDLESTLARGGYTLKTADGAEEDFEDVALVFNADYGRDMVISDGIKAAYFVLDEAQNEVGFLLQFDSLDSMDAFIDDNQLVDMEDYIYEDFIIFADYEIASIATK